jgi:cytochrome c peroxidase
MTRVKMTISRFMIFFIFNILIVSQAQSVENQERIFKAGHPSLQDWILPEQPLTPADNTLNSARIELGKKLFFDPRLSGDGNMACATCHNPLFGWSDGLATAKGNRSKVLGRASPVITNTAYNSIQMWDGRKKSLEDQAVGPMKSNDEMNMNLSELMTFLQNNREYSTLFKKAYPDDQINEVTLAKALASFERTVISRNSPFDQWLRGDKRAMTAAQVNGFKLFVDPKKGNCAACHSAPNFTDNGFHNIGLASFGDPNPDLGRYTERPLGLMKGAFKTPTIRDITLSAPYFHDGSAKTLTEVVKHYVSGGVVKTNLSPNFSPANLTDKEISNLVAFMESLTTLPEPFKLPILPLAY